MWHRSRVKSFVLAGLAIAACSSKPADPPAAKPVAVQAAGCTRPFEVTTVDDGAQYMKRLHDQLAADSKARAAGFVAGEDTWQVAGVEHADYYLAADDRGRLESYVAQLTRDSPIAHDHRIVVEGRAYTSRHMKGDPLALDVAPDSWRTFYVEAEPMIDDATFSSISADRAANEVRFVLSPGTARQFARVTAASVGHKLALIVEKDWPTIVFMAPLVRGAIADGVLAVDVEPGSGDFMNYALSSHTLFECP